jgi:tetratricopeptide (TPR) repeat protein
MFQIDLFAFIPEDLRKQILDSAVDFVARQAEKVAGDVLAEKLKSLRSDSAFQKKFQAGLNSAVERFIKEYEAEDEDLVAAIIEDRGFFQNKQIRQALFTIVQQPTGFLGDEKEFVFEQFESVLPARKNRDRVQKAIVFLLKCLAEELWHLPELQPVYSLQFQRLTAESVRQQVEIQKAQLKALVDLGGGIREALLQLTDSIEHQKLLSVGQSNVVALNVQVLHNLPNADYGQFIGREEEISQIHKILRPYPNSQHSLVTIDGIGGIGKSTLALEIAHHYLRNFGQLPLEECFEAIIWVSAKQTILTAQGIQTRPQVFRTLEDIYAAIAVTLQRQEITNTSPKEQVEIVRNALAHQRTLLVIDNLETVDDEKVITFMMELPAPTKAIITTRHRIDVAFPVRLKGMPWKDAEILISQECKKRNCQLSEDDSLRLYNYTGGVPLAIVWSIAQISFGYPTENILRRLGDADSDIARFCFEGSVSQIKDKPAYKILLALSLFATDASRDALGYVADISVYDRDEGLVDLERLSLVDKNGARFKFLPITKSYALSALNENPDVHLNIGTRWVAYLRNLSVGGKSEYYWKYKTDSFYYDGESILDAINWSMNYGNAEDVFELTYGAYDYCDVVGRWSEMLEICERVYNLAISIQGTNESAKLAIARLPSISGWIYMQRGEYEISEENFLKSIAQYRLLRSKHGEAISLQHIGSVYRKAGNFEKAKKFYDDAWQISKLIDDGDLEAFVNTSYGKLARDMKNWQLSWDYFIKVQDWFEKRVEQTPRDEPLARGTWGHLAIVAYSLGRYAEAKELCLKSLEYYEDLGPKGYLGTLKYRLALAESALGEYDSALTHIKESIEWFDRLGMKPDYVEAEKLLHQIANRESS